MAGDQRPYVRGFPTPATGVCEVCGGRYSASEGNVLKGKHAFVHEECANRGGETQQGRLFNPGPRQKYAFDDAAQIRTLGASVKSPPEPQHEGSPDLPRYVALHPVTEDYLNGKLFRQVGQPLAAGHARCPTCLTSVVSRGHLQQHINLIHSPE
jgi:hypothetical protein